MNRQMAMAAVLGLSSGAGSAFAQGMEWDQAWSFREAAGVGSLTDSSALGLSPTVEGELSGAIREHFTTVPADGPVVDEWLSVDWQVSADISWGRDADVAYARGEAAHDAVLQELGWLVDDTRELLPVELRPYLDRSQANGGIDSPYRLLDLGADQRDEILALQRERDRVLLDARQRHRPARLQAARQAFEAAVHELIRPEQQAELAQFQANIDANLETVLDRELANYPEDPTTEDAEGTEGTESGGQAAAVPQSRGQALAAILTNLAVRIREFLTNRAATPSAAPVAMAE